MKLSQSQVDANRRRILAAAACLFRQHGISGVSVNDVMKAAGMTHGGFYNHFKSKDDLVQASLGMPNDLLVDGCMSALDFSDLYLSRPHRDDVDHSCVFSSLGTELARGNARLRNDLTQNLRHFVAQMALPKSGDENTQPGIVGNADADAANDRETAIANVATLIGSVIMARIADDPQFSDDILAAGRKRLGLGSLDDAKTGITPASA
ncbi:TetR/AcrR family transcriptional regulator [Thalassospira mesophila]|uniref:TetR/AcrR family transcriptional regulator n=1 Tax=Thalassospira mesophila TaxID=1293891 RepID=UPI000A1F033E|nr:TetR/AcrR family transcriptional regulator [Thalassospira mesophila]